VDAVTSDEERNARRVREVIADQKAIRAVREKLYQWTLRSVFNVKERRDDLEMAYARGWNDAMANVRRKLDE